MKTISMKHGATAMLVSFVLFFSAYPSLAVSGENERGPVKIAYCDFVPFYFLGARGEPRGILVDFWRLWSEKSGVPVEFETTATWEDSMTRVRNGDADINAGIYHSEERDEFLDFTRPFLDLPAHLFYTDAVSPPKSLADIAGQKAGAVSEDYNAYYLRLRQPEAEITEYGTYERVARAALNGEISVFLMEKPIAMTYLAKLDGLDKIKMVDSPIHVSQVRGAVREGNTDLLEIVDRGLSVITKREIDAIVEDWTGQTKASSIFPSADTLIIANSIDSAPYHFTDEKGRPTGMLVDLWRLWAEKTGVNIQFKSGNFGDTLNFVRDGKADIQAGLFYSKTRDIFLDYTVPLCDVSTNFFFHESIYGLKNLEDLLGFKIGVIKGDLAVEFINRELPGATLATYSNNIMLFDAVERGEVRVFVKDTQIALAFLAKKGLLDEFRYHPARPLYVKKFHGAVREGNTGLLKKIDEGMSLISDRERAEIERRWTGVSSFKTRDVLIVACTKGYPPFTILNSQGKPAGLFVDFWRLWAEKANVKIEFRVTNWEETLSGTKDGSADIHSGMYRSEERKAWFDFSQPIYLTSANIFFHSEHGGLSGIAELAGQKVGALEGGYAQTYLRENWANIETIGFKTSERMIVAAGQGKIRAFLDETPTSIALLSKLGRQGEFNLLKEPLYSKKIYAAVKKGNRELLKKMDDGIQAMTNEELMEIEARWIANPDARYFRTVSPDILLTGQEEQWLRDHKTIRVCVDQNRPPLEFSDGRGGCRGMAADYVRILGERIGLSVEFVPDMPRSKAAEWVKTGRADAFPLLVPTPERSEYLRFSSPYVSSPQVIVTRRQAPFVGGIEDLRGRTVAVEKDHFLHEKLERDYPNISLQPVKSTAMALENVSLGRADAYAGNLLVISHLIDRLGLTNLKIASPTGFGNHDYSFAVRKDWPELAGIMEKGLKTISSEEHAEIRRRWVAVRYEHGIDREYVVRISVRVGLAAVAVLVLIFFWNRQIRRREERFRGLTEHGTDITQAFTREGVIVYQSPSHKTILKYENDSLVGTSALDLFHPDDLPVWEKARESLLADEGVQSIVHRLRKRDGEYLYFESNCINLLGNESLNSFVINARDITQRLKAERELNKTIERVSEANKKITESIEYARMIQRSILTDEAVVKQHVPHSFTVWMPRDVVGGDIVFSDFFENGFIGAVMDCTGHGVPGGFMTMIANTGLKRIIRDEGCRNPSQILKRLNFIVKTMLRQDRKYIFYNNSLDAAICLVTRETDGKTLTFAGARLPLYCMRDGELKVIRGDKQSIGDRRSDLDFEFKNHVMKIEKGMRFYMATDGFEDQLGADEKTKGRLKRFGKKRFAELIRKNSELGFEEQREKFLSVFNEYRGDNEAVDDVTVVGFGFE